jgi:hypothetical protein
MTKEIDLDNTAEFTLANGTPVTVSIQQKAYQRFTTDMLSFEYKNIYRPSRTDLGDNVFQTMIATSRGSAILIQEYKDMDPAFLVDKMLSELTKEEVEYGYTYKEEPIEQQVGPRTFKGKKALTTYPGSEWHRSVLTLIGRDRGILIVTLIDKDAFAADSDLIAHFWQSIELNQDLE